MTFSDTPTARNFLFLSLLVVLATTVSARKVNLKINLAGPPVDDFSGEEEILPLGEEAVKTRYHGTIQGSGSDLEVFKTQRFARYEDLVINVPVPNGIYSVTLMFAETWKGAYNAGKRVFDVYLGSKPGGVVKVAESFDPFRAGGPAAPVRKKYDHIATHGGLTVALRPIAQNPQIAGIIVSGFSYSESFIDELPTVEGNPSELQDYSILNSIGPRLPLDPLLLYDPSQNPKLKEKKGSLAGFAKLRTPVQVGIPAARASVHTQQAIFTPSGPNTRPLSAPIDLRAQKNALFNPPPPPSHSLSPQGSSSFIGLRSSTVRVSVPNGRPPKLPRSVEHAPEPPLPESLHASHRLRRHGRRLASLSVQAEDQPLSQGHDSIEASRPDHTPSEGSYPNYDPSATLSEPIYQGSSSRAIVNYNTDLQPRESDQTQARGDTKADRFSEIPTSRLDRELAQHEHRSLNRKTDPYSQSNTEDEQVIRQAQSESSQSASHLVSHSEPNAQPLELHSGAADVSSAGSLRSSSSMLRPLDHVTAPGPKVTDVYPDSMRDQENDGQSFQSSIEGRYLATPSGNVHRMPVQERTSSQAEGTDSRREVGPIMQNNEGSSSRNAMIGDTGYPKSIDNTEPSDTSIGNQTPKDFETGESVRSSQIGQRGSTAGSDSDASLTSNQVKMAAERQDKVRNYKRNLMSDPYGGSTVNKWQNGNTIKNPDTAIRQDRQMTEMRREEEDHVTSSRSLEMPTRERDVRSASLSGFHNSNFRAESNSMTGAMSPGVHNGIGRLDGLCIDNSTHCSCGMIEQRPDAQEDCLFVTDENRNPMACTVRPCNGKIICACASGASGLCQRSLVKNILVRAPTSDGVGDPTVVACRRETLEEGVNVLTPIL